jgi:D-lactate dehydrogenase (cytochrome)
MSDRLTGNEAMLGTPAERFCSAAGRARTASAIAELREKFSDRVSTVPAVREQHGRGEAFDAGLPPDAVVWPGSTAEVSAIVALCARHDVPLIAYGAGTSLEGHVSAPYGGVCVDLSRMNQVLAVHAEDFDCVVQPGVTREDLNSYLRDTGLFFSVDPGANATIGGMVSTRASGTTTVRYGAMPQNVLALEVVLADGQVIRCGTRARKSSAGYDLVRMFTGAEGTLGVITEVTLRLHGQPEAIGSATCAFPTLRAAVDTVTELAQAGAGLARIEFLDEVQVRACNRHSRLTLPEQPTLFMEFHGTKTGVTEQAAIAASVAAGNGGAGFAFSTQPEERAQLWRARHAAYFAALALRPGCVAIVADVCVPMSALPECVAETRADIDREGLVAPIVGHVGDGNFHVIFLLGPGSHEERERSDRVYDAMIARAHRVGGTCTGEHGIGLGKREKLLAEAGAEAVALMHRLKRAWDPQQILNPGKVFETR